MGKLTMRMLSEFFGDSNVYGNFAFLRGNAHKNNPPTLEVLEEIVHSCKYQHHRRKCSHDYPASMRKRMNACTAAGSGYFGEEHNEVFADINTNFFSVKRGVGEY
jgi:hypothetical protein